MNLEKEMNLMSDSAVSPLISVKTAVKIAEQYAIEMCEKQKQLCINQLRGVYSDGIKPLVNIISGTSLPKELAK